jgi:hypothetical protein
MDLMNTKPRELARKIRDFANRTAAARVRLSVHRHLLVAMLAANAHGDSHVPDEDTAGNPASATAEQAASLSGMLAVLPGGWLRSLKVIDSQSIPRTMKMRHVWFVPMLEVLLAPLEATKLDRPSITTRLSANVTPQWTVGAPLNAKFDSRAQPMTHPPGILSSTNDFRGVDDGLRRPVTAPFRMTGGMPAPATFSAHVAREAH